MPASALPILLVALACPSGFAFQGPADAGMDVHRAILPSHHAGVQGVLREGAGWRAFRRAAGPGWTARFDEVTGYVSRAWGPGVGLGDVSSEDTVIASVAAVLGEHPSLFGVDLARTIPHASYVARLDTWYVNFEQHVGGVPVYGRGLQARVRHGRLVAVASNVVPPWEPVEAVLTRGAAVSQAIRSGPVPGGIHEVLGGSLVYLAGPRIDRPGTLCWLVRTRTSEPPGLWRVFVNARTGAVESSENEILFAEGTVTAVHDERYPGGPTLESPVPFALVTGEDGRTQTDEDGWYSIAGDTARTLLSGRYVQVRNSAGPEGALDLGGDGVWEASSATQAEIDSYVFLHDVRAWAETYSPEVPVVSERITSNVNLSGSCNAYWDGSVNFYGEGGGCNNTAQIADVNYHEWCHGFHYYSLEAGTFDGTVSEGVGDLCSCLLTDDSVVGRYMYLDGSYIRDIEEDRVYPDDVVGETHTDSLVFSGAVWDFYSALREREGDTEAFDVVSQLLADSIKSGFTLTEAYDEFLLADDDDGDVTNGTPHQCDLLVAFAAHGLGPATSGGLATLDHEPVTNQPDDGRPIPVFATFTDNSGGCMEYGVNEARLHVSIDGGVTWTSEAMDLGSDEMTGALAAQPAGTVVHYYIEALTGSGEAVYSPSGGDVNPHSFYVGTPSVVYEEDFEAGEGGYTHGLLEGEDRLGADDWQWGEPQGQAGDPSSAASGANVWGNDLGGDDWNGEYQNRKWNRLESPSIAVAPYADVLLQFRRWLTVEDGYYDHARILLDDGEVWSNHATDEARGDEHHQDDQWMLATVLAEDVDRDGMVRIAWELESDAGLSFGGWNLDDVSVLIPDTARNRLVIKDFSASDDAPTVRLSWTNPVTPTLDRVAVVWRADRYPTSVEDGDTVALASGAVPGEAMEIRAEPSTTGWFAVFAGQADGVWSVGAYEGYNADTGVDGEGEEVETGVADSGDLSDDTGADSRPPLDYRPQCGCAAGSSEGGAGRLAGGIALLALALRRCRRGRNRVEA